MSGNVAEWCFDLYEEIVPGTVTDPVGAETGTNRVSRGGGWRVIARGACVGFRAFGTSPDTHSESRGFRIVRSIR